MLYCAGFIQPRTAAGWIWRGLFRKAGVLVYGSDSKLSVVSAGSCRWIGIAGDSSGTVVSSQSRSGPSSSVAQTICLSRRTTTPGFGDEDDKRSGRAEDPDGRKGRRGCGGCALSLPAICRTGGASLQKLGDKNRRTFRQRQGAHGSCTHQQNQQQENLLFSKCRASQK